MPAALITATGPTSPRSYVYPDANGTMLTSVTTGFLFDTTSKKFTVGQSGNNIAAVAINHVITDPLFQFGLNVIPTYSYVGSSTEATGIRTVVTLSANVVKGASAGLVVEGPQLGAGASMTEYYSGIFRGGHAATGLTFACSLAVETSADRTLWIGNDMDGTTWQKGIVFGVSSDTNLYRSAANTLQTDDTFVVTGTMLSIGGTASASFPAMRNNGGTLEFIKSDVSAFARVKAQRIFVDAIEGNLAAPSSPGDGQWWVEFTGTTPSRQLRIAVRDGGVTYTQNVGAAH